MPPLQVERLDPTDGLMMTPDSGVKDKDKFKVKCVLVGDGATGKTSLILSYSSNAFPTEYIPTAYDTYSVDVSVDNNPVRLELCDTAGQDDFDNLRPLCYPGTDVFLLCFSVVNPTSFHNIREKWVPELKRKFPKVPMILVGTLCDLRGDVRELIQLDRYNERPVSEQEAEQAVKDIGAVCYVECSALTQKNMKDVFDTAIFCALDRKGLLPRSAGGHSRLGFGSKRWKKYKHSHTVEFVCKTSGSPCENGAGHTAAGHTREHQPKNGSWKKFCCFL